MLATGKVDPGALGSLPNGVHAARIQPQLDVLEHASGLEAIGAGVQLRTEQLDGESLRAAVDAAASRTARVHELRADVRSFGGAAIAADTVERLCV